MMLPESKYEGILKDCNLEIIDDKLVKILIDREIYHVVKSLKIEFKLKLKMSEEVEKPSLDNNFEFKGKEYQINKTISRDIYKQLEFYVKNIGSDIDYNSKNLNLKLNAFIEKNDIINFLKKTHETYFLKLSESNDAIVFLGGSFNGFDNWKDLIIYSIDNFFIKQYLKDEIINFNNSIIKKWIEYHELNSIINFCKEKISELTNIKKNEAPKTNVTDIIFKDDGLKMFNHIQSTYSDKKNLAFFSYLYFFLQSKMKLQVYSNDSIDFRTFVLSKFTELKKFSRVIPPNPDSTKTKDRIENTFNELLKSYSDTN